MSSVRIIIFAKAPLAGQAKTRLIPALGPDGSAALAARLLHHTAEQALKADLGPVGLCITRKEHPIWESLTLPPGLQWSEQGPGDLGKRLDLAVQRAVGRDERVLLIGTDCPALDAVHMARAASALEAFDASLIPVADGSYALIGLRDYHSSIFTEIPWSTSRVSEITCTRINDLGWTLKVLPPLHDIDEPEDLQWLPEGLAV